MTIINMHLTNDERLFLEQNIKLLTQTNTHNTSELDIAYPIAQNIKLFMPKFAKQVDKMSDNDDIIAIMINNLPKLETTDTRVIQASKYISMAIAYLLGEPFQYYEQEPNEIVTEIRPKKHLQHTQSSGGKLAFDWHTDESCFPVRFRATWLILFGITNINRSLTKIAPIDQILHHLSSHDKQILMSKRYLIELPKSFKVDMTKHTPPVSVLRINGDGHYEIAVRTNNVIPANPLDTEAMSAIQNLIEAASKSKVEFCVEDGTAIIFNNNRCLHSRDAIIGERIVLRTYARNNLSQLRKHTKEINPNIFMAQELINFYR